MKKYIFIWIAMIALVLLPMALCNNSSLIVRHIPQHSKLLKETWVWLYDSACYRESGMYLRKYRKYDYHYSDSTEEMGREGDDTMTRYYLSPKGDTVCIEYIDTTDYPHREE